MARSDSILVNKLRVGSGTIEEEAMPGPSLSHQLQGADTNLALACYRSRDLASMFNIRWRDKS